MASENLITGTADNFEEQTKEGISLADFWAEWCGPCHMIAPAVEQLADEMAGKVKVLKVNVDEQPALANQFGIRGIPTLKIFKDGKEVEELVGVRPLPEIKEKLQAHLEE